MTLKFSDKQAFAEFSSDFMKDARQVSNNKQYFQSIVLIFELHLFYVMAFFSFYEKRQKLAIFQTKILCAHRKYFYFLLKMLMIRNFLFSIMLALCYSII